MKVSWKLLNQIVDLNNITLTEFTNKLTLAGFEVESINHKKNPTDIIIDLNITSNRPDLSYLVGLAREVSIIFNKKLNRSTIDFKDLNQLDTNNTCNNQKFETIQDINYINISIIDDIQNMTTPTWLQNFLNTYDIESHNLLNDIIEYIQIKWGQTLEIFDTKTLNTNQTKEPNTINFLDIQKNELYKEIITETKDNNIQSNQYPYVLTYNQQPLSVLGIKPNTNLTPNFYTSSIIIIQYTCTNQYIRNINQLLQIKPVKYIQDQISHDFINAYNETIYLILYLTKCYLVASYQTKKISTPSLSLIISKDEINNILGPTINETPKYLSEADISSILKQLKFQHYISKNLFNIKIPQYRLNDITRNIDIIEEIGRIYGFNNFIDCLPSKYTYNKTPKLITFIRKIKTTLRNIGLHEVVHYSLRKKLNQDQNQNAVSLYNPLLEEQSQLRTNLLNSLINTKKYNTQQKNWLTEIFEVGTTFHKTSLQSNQIEEKIHLAGLLSNTNYIKYSWSDTPQPLTWFHAKGQLEEFFERINANIQWLVINNKKDASYEKLEIYKLFHTQRTTLIVNKYTLEEIGIFGQINLKLAKSYHINPLTYIFELNITKLLNTIQYTHNKAEYIIKPYSNYPYVTRDITFILNDKSNIEYIKHKITETNNSLIESIEIINEYTQNSTEISIRRICIRITYRAHNRTLNNQDIAKINENINQLMLIESTNEKPIE